MASKSTKTNHNLRPGMRIRDLDPRYLAQRGRERTGEIVKIKGDLFATVQWSTGKTTDVLIKTFARRFEVIA